MSNPKSNEVAIGYRGDCEFVIKAINAQAAGYKGLIILDTKNETKFRKIIYSANNSVPASFVRIPIIFLKFSEAKIVQKLPLNGQKFDIVINYEEKGKLMVFPNFIKKHLWTELPDKFKTFVSQWSPLSLILMGGIAVIILIFIIACQVCICSKCFRKRQNSRVLPDSCSEHSPEIPYMTSQLPNAIPYDQATYNNDRHQDAQVEVACPVCLEIPLPPRKIYQCSQGHALCDLCLSRIDQKCPTCREDWGNSAHLPARNRMAETMIQNYFGNNIQNQPNFNEGYVPENPEGPNTNRDAYAPSAPAPPVMSDYQGL